MARSQSASVITGAGEKAFSAGGDFELIKGLLDLSKLESGTMSLRKQPLDIGPLISDVEQTMTPHAKKKGIAPHIAQITGRRMPGLLDGRTTRHASYRISQRKRKRGPQEGEKK